MKPRPKKSTIRVGRQYRLTRGSHPYAGAAYYLWEGPRRVGVETDMKQAVDMFQAAEETWREKVLEEERRSRYGPPEGSETRSERPARAQNGAGRQRLYVSMEWLQGLDGRQFEALIEGLFEDDGYTVHRTSVSGDEGIDLVVSSGGARDIVQCKRWKKPVGSPQLRDFYGALMHSGARHGFLITTASFSRTAISFAEGKRITLIDGSKLLGWINKGKPSYRG